MDAAGAAAALTMRARVIVLRRLDHWVRLRRRKRIGADRWQGGRGGHAERANEDRDKNVTHFVTPLEPIGSCKLLAPSRVEC
jgi:hypothetical protein